MFGPFERAHRVGDAGVIDADRAGRDAEVADAERVEQVLAHRLTGFRAQPLDVAGSVVAGEGRQVDAGDRPQQPRRLPVLLDRAARAQRRGAAFGRAQVDAGAVDPAQIERDARVAFTLLLVRL